MEHFSEGSMSSGGHLGLINEFRGAFRVVATFWKNMLLLKY